MTVEELEILVDASIEPAINKLKKLMPQIKQTVTQAVETANKSMQNINTEQVQGKVRQVVQRMKKHFQDLKKSTENNEISIKINNKEAEKQISQLQKQIDSLNEKISSRQIKLRILQPKLDSISEQPMNKIMPERLENNQQYINLSDKETQLVEELRFYNKQLDEAKIKMSQLRQETENTATTQNKLSSFFSGFKGKIDQAKGSIGNLKGQFNQLPKITQKITNNIKNMGSKLKSGIGHVLKYAGALLGIRAVYNLLRQSASAWLSSQNSGAQQLSANIEYMKYAMGSALAPIIEYVVSLVYTLLKAIQQVAYALTGVNIFAKATASSMKSTAGSAKKAKKEMQGLADIDEIHNIQKDNGSDAGSGSGSPSPSFDLSSMDNTTNSIIDAIKKGDWYGVGAELGNKLNEAMRNIPWDKIKKGARNIASGIADFLNGFIKKTDWTLVGETLAEGINTAIEFLYTFITKFDWKEFGKSLGKFINGLFKKIDWKKVGKTFGEAIKGIFNSIASFLEEVDWADIVKDIEDFIMGVDWKGVAKAIFRAIGAAIGGLASMLVQILFDAATEINKAIDKNIEECGGNVIKGFLKGIKDNFVQPAKWIYDNIFIPFIEGFKKAFGIHSPSKVMEQQGKYVIDGFKNGLKGIWNSVKDIISNLAKNMKTKFTDAKNKVVDVFKSMKTKIKDIFQGIWNNIKNVINSILGGIEKMANGVVRGLNKVIDAMNKLKFKIPDWVPGSMGGKEFGFNIGTIGEISIPRLAKGGVLYDDTIIRAGEYSNARRNPEIIAPQNIMADTFEKVLSKYNNGNSSIYGEAELKVNGKTLARATIFDFNNEAKRLGYKPILQRG